VSCCIGPMGGTWKSSCNEKKKNNKKEVEGGGVGDTKQKRRLCQVLFDTKNQGRRKKKSNLGGRPRDFLSKKKKGVQSKGARRRYAPGRKNMGVISWGWETMKSPSTQILNESWSENNQPKGREGEGGSK